MVERVTLWDVGAERQASCAGPTRWRFADYLSPRGRRPAGRRLPLHDASATARAGDGRLHRAAAVRRRRVVSRTRTSTLDLWAYGLALARGADVEVRRPTWRRCSCRARARSTCSRRSPTATSAALPRFRCVAGNVAGVAVRRLQHGLEQGGRVRDLPARHRARAASCGTRSWRPASRTGCWSRARTSPRRGAGHHGHAVPRSTPT